nr:MAG TPA: hypothetical protein [Caudoviricetes sp.]
MGTKIGPLRSYYVFSFSNLSRVCTLIFRYPCFLLHIPFCSTISFLISFLFNFCSRFSTRIFCCSFYLCCFFSRLIYVSYIACLSIRHLP